VDLSWGKLGFLPRSGTRHPNIPSPSAIQDDDKELACIYMQRHVPERSGGVV
jgi:hypothetical protein